MHQTKRVKMPSSGEKCSVLIPVSDSISISDVDAIAATELQKVCHKHGLTATNIHCITHDAKTVDPRYDSPHLTLHIYQATACR